MARKAEKQKTPYLAYQAICHFSTIKPYTIKPLNERLIEPVHPIKQSSKTMNRPRTHSSDIPKRRRNTASKKMTMSIYAGPTVHAIRSPYFIKQDVLRLLLWDMLKDTQKIPHINELKKISAKKFNDIYSIVAPSQATLAGITEHKRFIDHQIHQKNIWEIAEWSGCTHFIQSMMLLIHQYKKAKKPDTIIRHIANIMASPNNLHRAFNKNDLIENTTKIAEDIKQLIHIFYTVHTLQQPITLYIDTAFTKAMSPMIISVLETCITLRCPPPKIICKNHMIMTQKLAEWPYAIRTLFSLAQTQWGVMQHVRIKYPKSSFQEKRMHIVQRTLNKLPFDMKSIYCSLLIKEGKFDALFLHHKTEDMAAMLFHIIYTTTQTSIKLKPFIYQIAQTFVHLCLNQAWADATEMMNTWLAPWFDKTHYRALNEAIIEYCALIKPCVTPTHKISDCLTHWSHLYPNKHMP